VHDKEQIRLQVERIARSSELQNSEVLSRLFLYLAKHAVEEPGVNVKEYQIASEVYGRSDGYDPQVDNSVRVQVGRLRNKLAAYYAAEGARDKIHISIPKGAYLLHVDDRPPAAPSTAASSATEAEAPIRRYLVWVLAALLLAALVGDLVLLRRPTAQANTAPESLRIFWSEFANTEQPPWVIFSNASFVGRPETGMKYYDPARDNHEAIHDFYTGVGETLAVHHLDLVFSQLRASVRVKRGSMFTLDDLSQNNLIFLGSPSENPTLSEIPNTREFVFQRATTGDRVGDLGILNRHPQSGEPAMVFASLSGQDQTEDYAVIGLEPGSEGNHKVLILAGTTTMGTQAAAEFVCRPESVQLLLARLNVKRASEMRPFEALLHIKIARGVPVGADLLAVRVH